MDSSLQLLWPNLTISNPSGPLFPVLTITFTQMLMKTSCCHQRYHLLVCKFKSHHECWSISRVSRSKFRWCLFTCCTNGRRFLGCWAELTHYTQDFDDKEAFQQDTLSIFGSDTQELYKSKSARTTDPLINSTIARSSGLFTITSCTILYWSKSIVVHETSAAVEGRETRVDNLEADERTKCKCFCSLYTWQR